MNAEIYAHILDNNLLQIYTNNNLFQDDNDPKHRSKFVTNWKYKNNISCLEWPSNSPDLNPIENIWFIVKNNVSRKRTNTSEEFELSIRHELDNIDINIIKNVIKSMPKRIEEVIKNNGDHINY
jgi:transposase